MISKVKETLEESVKDMVCAYYSTVFPECLRIADLGCSSGPNTLSVVSEIIDTIDETRLCLNKKPPVFQVFLNDLPRNDFNNIFQSLLPSFCKWLEKDKGSEFGPCFVAAVPGSFYGRLFPNQFHALHSLLLQLALA